MSLPVILRPEADADIQLTHDELEQVKAGLGDRFVARVREVLERIEAMLEMYGLVWRDVRAARLKKFRHVLYYVAFADRVIDGFGQESTQIISTVAPGMRDRVYPPPVAESRRPAHLVELIGLCEPASAGRENFSFFGMFVRKTEFPRFTDRYNRYGPDKTRTRNKKTKTGSEPS